MCNVAAIMPALMSASVTGHQLGEGLSMPPPGFALCTSVCFLLFGGWSCSFSRAVTGFGKSPDADAQVLPPKVTVGPGGRGIKIFPVQGRALVFW